MNALLLDNQDNADTSMYLKQNKSHWKKKIGLPTQQKDKITSLV